MSETEQTAAGQAAADVQASAHEGNSAAEQLAPHEVARVEAAMDLAREQADPNGDDSEAFNARVDQALAGAVPSSSARLAADAQAGVKAALAAQPAPRPSLGRIVIVREEGKKDAPGIIAEVFEDTITCNVFRGDHIPHVAHSLTQIDPSSGGSGWFWPPRI